MYFGGFRIKFQAHLTLKEREKVERIYNTQEQHFKRRIMI